MHPNRYEKSPDERNIYQRHTDLVNENTRLKMAIRQTLEELTIMDDSQGVAGWHLNGNVATWAEVGFEDLRDELIRVLGG